MRKIGLLMAALLSGCVNAANHVNELHSSLEHELTLGTVQRDIHPGMSQGDVASILGSPNIVSTEDNGHEVWIYDKVASESSYSASSGGFFGLGAVAGVPGTTPMGGIGGGDYSKRAGAAANTQKTLTVVIKFDASHRVESTRYHSSRF